MTAPAPLTAVLPVLARPFLERALPDDVSVRWFARAEEAHAAIPDADIAWVDMQRPDAVGSVLADARRLRWLATIYAGLDAFPLDHLRAMGTVVTNGRGINAAAVADFAVMGVLVAAKRLDRVLRAGDARHWLPDAPGKTELDRTAALVIGYGTIGRLIGDRLRAFGVAVTGVRRAAGPDAIGPDDWRARLAEFDWVILAAPSTDETQALIGAADLRAMKREAWLINVARGDMVDGAALVAALRCGDIAGAVLDTVDPEPLPADHPLWSAPNAILTMHLSGRSQTGMFARAAALFLDNLDRFRTGRPMLNAVDLARGY